MLGQGLCLSITIGAKGRAPTGRSERTYRRVDPKIILVLPGGCQLVVPGVWGPARTIPFPIHLQEPDGNIPYNCLMGQNDQNVRNQHFCTTGERISQRTQKQSAAFQCGALHHLTEVK